MGTELATIVAVRRTATSTVSTRSGIAARGHEALAGRLRSSRDDIDIVAFATPSAAFDAVEDVLAVQPLLAVGVHVAELVEDAGMNQAAVDVVSSLASRAAVGEVVVTDVVAQLAGGTGRSFAGRGHADVAGRPTRVHALAHQHVADGGPTFGRAVELASVDWLVDELLAGSGRALIFEGEAGIGKTHLTEEAVRRAEAAGIRVVRAGADELGRDHPGYVATALLAHLDLPASDEQLDARPPDGGDHRFVEQFTAVVETVAQDHPVLLIAEDLHWADDLSLRAVGALAPRLAPISAAVIVSFRPAPRPGLLRKLEDVLEDAGAERHALDPLEPEAVTSLVATRTGAPPGERLRDRLLMTAGNPLFVIEMLSALHDDGALDVDAGVVDVADDVGALPEQLRDTALRRIRDLPDATVSLLRHASLLGSTCGLDALCVVTGRAATAVVEDLLPAVEASVLARAGDSVEYRHDVIREAIVADIAPAVRQEMHTAAGAALAQAGASPVDVARQLALGARPGDTQPVEWLERAAQDVRALDPWATVELLEEALGLAPAGWNGIDRVECSMIEPLTACGRVDEAVEHAEAVLTGTLETDLRLRATSGLVSALATRGDLGRAAEAAAQASADPSIGEHQRLLFDCIATSLRIFVDGSAEDVDRAARTALESNVGADGTAVDQDLACWARHSLGLAALVDGRYEQALVDFDGSSRLLERLDISDHGFLIPHVHAATAAAYLDDFETADARLGAVMRRCSSRGEPTMLVIGHLGDAMVSWLGGGWDDALTEVEAGLSLASDTGADSMTIGLHGIAALVHAGRGRPGESDHHLARGFQILERGAHLFGVDLLVLAQARRLEEARALDEAAQLLAGFWDRAGHIALALQYRDLLPHVVRLAGPLLGDRQASVLEVVDRAAQNTPIPSTIAAASRCRGLATHDVDLLIEAVERLRGNPRRIELAEALEEAATVCFAAGRSDDATRLVDEAVQLWEDASASNHISRLDAIARRNGVRRRRSRPAGATHGWEALSPKELEVVDLVADGLSNPEIGERLYISRRTVESHLSHVFTKLGLSNRAQVAAAVVEQRGPRRDP